MDAGTGRHFSPFGLAAIGAGFCAGLAGLTVITVKMAAPANVAAAQVSASDEYGPAQAGSQDSIVAMCTKMLKGRTDLMDQCRDEEQVALQYVNSYLQTNGLLGEDGSIDLEKLADSAADSLSPVDDDAGAIISYCLQNSPDWISTQDCINSLDSDAAYEVLRGGSPGADGLPGADDGLPGGGANGPQ